MKWHQISDGTNFVCEGRDFFGTDPQSLFFWHLADCMPCDFFTVLEKHRLYYLLSFFFFLNQNITFTHNLNKFNPFSQKGLIDSLTASYSYSTSYGEFRLWKQLPSISWALGFTQEQGLLLDWPSFCVFPGKSRCFLT